MFTPEKFIQLFDGKVTEPANAINVSPQNLIAMRKAGRFPLVHAPAVIKAAKTKKKKVVLADFFEEAT